MEKSDQNIPRAIRRLCNKVNETVNHILNRFLLKHVNLQRQNQVLKCFYVCLFKFDKFYRTVSAMVYISMYKTVLQKQSCLFMVGHSGNKCRLC